MSAVSNPAVNSSTVGQSQAVSAPSTVAPPPPSSLAAEKGFLKIGDQYFRISLVTKDENGNHVDLPISEAQLAALTDHFKQMIAGNEELGKAIQEKSKFGAVSLNLDKEGVIVSNKGKGDAGEKVNIKNKDELIKTMTLVKDLDLSVIASKSLPESAKTPPLKRQNASSDLNANSGVESHSKEATETSNPKSKVEDKSKNSKPNDDVDNHSEPLANKPAAKNSPVSDLSNQPLEDPAISNASASKQSISRLSTDKNTQEVRKENVHSERMSYAAKVMFFIAGAVAFVGLCAAVASVAATPIGWIAAGLVLAASLTLLARMAYNKYQGIPDDTGKQFKNCLGAMVMGVASPLIALYVGGKKLVAEDKDKVKNPFEFLKPPSQKGSATSQKSTIKSPLESSLGSQPLSTGSTKPQTDEPFDALKSLFKSNEPKDAKPQSQLKTSAIKHENSQTLHSAQQLHASHSASISESAVPASPIAASSEPGSSVAALDKTQNKSSVQKPANASAKKLLSNEGDKLRNDSVSAERWAFAAKVAFFLAGAVAFLALAAAVVASAATPIGWIAAGLVVVGLICLAVRKAMYKEDIMPELKNCIGCMATGFATTAVAALILFVIVISKGQVRDLPNPFAVFRTERRKEEEDTRKKPIPIHS